MVSDNNLHQVQRALSYEVINKGKESNPINTYHNVSAQKQPMCQQHIGHTTSMLMDALPTHMEQIII